MTEGGITSGDWNKQSAKKELVGSRLRWAGHILGMSEEQLTKGAWATEEGGRRRRLTLSWMDRVKKDLEKT